jgi:hypothetical protein
MNQEASTEPIRDRPNPDLYPVNAASAKPPEAPATESGQTMPMAASPQAHQPERPNLERIRSGLLEAVQEQRSKPEMLKRLVAGELRAGFGVQVTPAMEHAVADALTNDPHLMSLLNQLIGKVMTS